MKPLCGSNADSLYNAVIGGIQGALSKEQGE